MDIGAILAETILPNISTFQNEKRKQLFQNSRTADVIFKCPNQEKDGLTDIYGHKSILSIASDVFETMFYGSIPESSKMEDGKVVVMVPDIKPPTFLLMLKPIYGLDVNVENIAKAFELLYAAHKYDTKDVLDMVERFLTETLDIFNVLYIYEHSVHYQLISLEKKCLQFISSDTIDILPMCFMAKPETINAIFNQVSLNIDSEYQLVQFLQRYIKKHRDHDLLIQEKVRPAINAIRFLTLTDWEISTTTFLTDTEIEEITLNKLYRTEELSNGLCGNVEGRQLRTKDKQKKTANKRIIYVSH